MKQYYYTVKLISNLNQEQWLWLASGFWPNVNDMGTKFNYKKEAITEAKRWLKEYPGYKAYLVRTVTTSYESRIL